MNGDNSRISSARPDKVRDALLIIEDSDKHRNLHDAIPFVLFFASAGFSVRSFFWIIDFTTWLGFDKLGPVVPASLAFIFLFVVWIFTFLAFMSLLAATKFTNVRNVASYRLSNLMLNPSELREIQDIVTSRTWKHDYILKSVVASLADRRGALS
jgi:hypothetical protein